MHRKKVFGIGLSRTGTTSLHVASLILGLSAVHYPREAASRWFRGDFSRETTDHFDVITDLPTPVYFQQLDTTHPGSRFILTIRSIDSWLESVEKFFAKSPPESAETLLRDFIRIACYGTTRFHRQRMMSVYMRHIELVQNYFRQRPSDLMIINISEETNPWDRLCAFLEMPVPKMGFPHLRAPGIGQLTSVRHDEKESKRRLLMRVLHAIENRDHVQGFRGI